MSLGNHIPVKFHSVLFSTNLKDARKPFIENWNVTKRLSCFVSVARMISRYFVKTNSLFLPCYYLFH